MNKEFKISHNDKDFCKVTIPPSSIGHIRGRYQTTINYIRKVTKTIIQIDNNGEILIIADKKDPESDVQWALQEIRKRYLISLVNFQHPTLIITLMNVPKPTNRNKVFMNFRYQNYCYVPYIDNDTPYQGLEPYNVKKGKSVVKQEYNYFTDDNIKQYLKTVFLPYIKNSYKSNNQIEFNLTCGLNKRQFYNLCYPLRNVIPVEHYMKYILDDENRACDDPEMTEQYKDAIIGDVIVNNGFILRKTETTVRVDFILLNKRYSVKFDIVDNMPVNPVLLHIFEDIKRIHIQNDIKIPDMDLFLSRKLNDPFSMILKAHMSNWEWCEEDQTFVFPDDHLIDKVRYIVKEIYSNDKYNLNVSKIREDEGEEYYSCNISTDGRNIQKYLARNSDSEIYNAMYDLLKFTEEKIKNLEHITFQ